MSADAFLKALQRDVAWGFFYGMVNFDGVFGTVNHYGTVDLFAGRYNDAYRKAELDHLENFADPADRETFKAMLDDWTNEGFDPFAARTRPARPSAPRTATTARPSPATGSRPRAWSGCKGDVQLRSDDNGYPGQPPVRRRPPGRAGDPRRAGLRGRAGLVQPVRLPVALGRDLEPVGRLGGARTACSARPPRSTSCRSSTATTASSGSSSCPTRSSGTSRTATPAARAKVMMKAGRRRRHAGRHPPPGLLAQALDAAGLGERRPPTCPS